MAVQRSGEVELGGGLIPGQPYYLSQEPGGIAPLADSDPAEVALIGMAKNSSALDLRYEYPVQRLEGDDPAEGQADA